MTAWFPPARVVLALASLLPLYGCAGTVARPPLVDPVSSLVEAWRQHDLARAGAPPLPGPADDDGRAEEDRRFHAVAERLLAANADLLGPQPPGTVLLDGHAVQAWAEERRLVALRPLVRFVADDAALAVVLGHELAHWLLRHLDKQEENAGVGATIGKVVAVIAGAGPEVGRNYAAVGRRLFSRAFEKEADYVGLYLAARAGFAVAEAADFWRRMAVLNPDAIDTATSHPTTADRFLAMERTIREIAAKRAAGLPLLPDGVAARE